MEALSSCKTGNHELTIIYRGRGNGACQEIVRWCVNCGSVVVDLDYDGRTNAGQIMKMRSPKITKVAINS